MIVQLTYCQETYPKVISIKGEKVVVITPEQVKQVNVAYLEIEMLNYKLDFMNNMSARRSELISSYKDKVDLLTIEVELGKQIRNDLQDQIMVLKSQKEISEKLTVKSRGSTFKGVIIGGCISMSIVGVFYLINM